MNMIDCWWRIYLQNIAFFVTGFEFKHTWIKQSIFQISKPDRASSEDIQVFFITNAKM